VEEIHYLKAAQAKKGKYRKERQSLGEEEKI
jgi:hypothetical protein